MALAGRWTMVMAPPLSNISHDSLNRQEKTGLDNMGWQWVCDVSALVTACANFPPGGSYAPSAKRSRGEPRDPEDEVMSIVRNQEDEVMSGIRRMR